MMIKNENGSWWRINKTLNYKPKLNYNGPLGIKMEVNSLWVIA